MTNKPKKPQVLITKFDDDGIASILEKLDEIESLYPPTQTVLIHIDSYGGAVKGMSLLYDRIITMPHQICTYTSGMAMSAGAILLATVGTPGLRYASPEANILIHELQVFSGGDIKDVEDRTIYHKQMNQRWMTILAKSMGLKDHRDVRRLIKEKAIGQDIYLSAQQAKNLGVIDEVAHIRLEREDRWDLVKYTR